MPLFHMRTFLYLNRMRYQGRKMIQFICIRSHCLAGFATCLRAKVVKVRESVVHHVAIPSVNNSLRQCGRSAIRGDKPGRRDRTTGRGRCRETFPQRGLRYLLKSSVVET